MDKINDRVITPAKILWNYHRLNQTPRKADLILVLGSHDLRVAERGAELFLNGYAPRILFSGGLGKLTKDMGQLSEANKFAKVAIDKGVPADSILVEDKSTNSGENIQFCYKLLTEKGLIPKKMILVQKPYMERRSYATFLKQWPERTKPVIMVTSPQLSFEDYCMGGEIPVGEVIDLMVGDLQRIREYPEKGFQIPQEIPEDVWAAYEELVKMGYTKHLIKE